jgi:hypothetical protein
MVTSMGSPCCAAALPGAQIQASAPHTWAQRKHVTRGIG